MQYISTRGGMNPCSFSDVLLMGTASNNGLSVPINIPKFSKPELKEMSKYSYQELALKILKIFCNDIPENDLKQIINKTFSKKHFTTEEITPVDQTYTDFYIAHLSEGPTYSFKDLALQLVLPLMEYVLDKQDSFLNIVAATSGDTGSATENPAIGKKRINVIMLTPHNKMSKFQTAQMYTINQPNIFNIAINGVFDTCQFIKKEIDKDSKFKEQYHIGAANSINWARIAAQIIYQFKVYFSIKISSLEPIDIVIPSGNFGHALSAYYARQMGIPFNRIIIATNENNVLNEFFKTGIYKIRKKEDVIPTNSPSMDIAISSNLERLLFHFFNNDEKITKNQMEKLSKTGEIDLNEYPEYKKHLDQSNFSSGESTDIERINVIKRIYEEKNIIIDPHTAAGVKVAFEKKQDIPILCMETAKPFKFNPTIKKAINKPAEMPKKAKEMQNKEQFFTEMEPDIEKVKNFIRKHALRET
ncbi:MAG: threonine synthase [Candidatus Woesearchaeota archaeon]